MNENPDARAAKLEAYLSTAEAARAAARRCPLHRETPLLEVPEVAREAGVARVFAKDERGRFGLGAFKALGAPYAMLRLLEEGGGPRTFVTASAGNHGAAVAAMARAFGRKAAVVLPDSVDEDRAAFLRALGADVRRAPGSFEDAVEAARSFAEAEGAAYTPDVGPDAPDSFARRVVEGYGVLALEALDQFDALGLTPTHLFVQAGVGGLAAAAAGVMTAALGADRLRVAVVEPVGAEAVAAARAAGRVVAAEHTPSPAMSMLDCAEASEAAMGVLGAIDFLHVAVEAADAEAAAGRVDGLTPSAAAGLAGLLDVAGDAAERARFGLDENSVVAVVFSESAPAWRAAHLNPPS